jgi:glycosyltransferase involved in cell wall biosynthesis
MASKLPISVFIIAFNEADRIARAIESVRAWADEVVVVDSLSTDETSKIADSLGTKVFFNKWPGYGLQKRYAEDQCSNKWLLNLDADEEITPELAAEIEALFASGEPSMSGYVLQIRDLLPGEEKLAHGAHTNFVLRLYNREKGRFSDSPVHDAVQIEQGGVAMLEQPVLHRSFRDLAHAIDKMNSYTSAQAKNLMGQNLMGGGMTLPLLRLLTEFPIAFFKDYVLRFYFLRGRRGFVYAVTYAYTRFVRIAKYLELKDRP